MGLAMQVENISAGGLFVKSDDLLPIGSPIALELMDGAPSAPLKLTGRVVGHVTRWQAKTHGRTPGMGIQFDPLTAESQKRLDKLLASLRKAKGAGSALVDAEVEATRSVAFDFGFSSLEDFADEPELPPEAQQVVAAPPDQFAVPHEAKLMVQVKGLLLELGDTQAKIARLEKENELLKSENKKLKDELARYRRPI